MASDHVEHQLANWADWHRNSSTNLGYPTKAMVALGGGQSVEGVFEYFCECADRHAAEVMETLVNDLLITERTAVYHHWLGCKIKPDNQEQALEDAYCRLAVKMGGRGLA